MLQYKSVDIGDLYPVSNEDRCNFLYNSVLSGVRYDSLAIKPEILLWSYLNFVDV